MAIRHLLKRPLRKSGDGRVVWGCECGMEVILPPQAFPAGTRVETPDPKERPEPIECAACFAGEDAEGEEAPPITEQGDIKTTFDQDLGEASEDLVPTGKCFSKRTRATTEK